MLPKFYQDIFESLKNGSRILRVGVLSYVPYVMPCWNNFHNNGTTTLCKNPGLSIEIINELCSYLGIQCLQIPVDHNMFGDNSMGEWRGMIRQIMDNEFDMSMPNFSPTKERSKVVDFSIPVYTDYPAIMTRFPVTSVFSIWSIFGFSFKSWALIVGTILLIGVLSSIFNWFQNNSSDKIVRFSFKKYSMSAIREAMDVASLFTDQGVADRNFSPALCVLFGIWSLCCVVLAGIYSSQILVSSLATDLSLPFSDLMTLAQCIKNRNCALTASTVSTAFFERVRKAGSAPMRQMKEALEIQPVAVESSNNLVPAILRDHSQITCHQ